jgi:hypothetical protein
LTASPRAPAPLLAGLELGPVGTGPEEEVAAWLLTAMGATVNASHRGQKASCYLVRGRTPDDGLPAGTVRYAAGVALAAAALAGWRWGRPVGVSETGVAVQVLLPEVMAAAYRSPVAMPLPAPMEAPGGGWLHADLGSPGDRDRFETVLSTLPPGANAEMVAAAAQEWRLAVCEYRPRPSTPLIVPISWQGSGSASPPRPAVVRSLDGIRICDLTAMWAGPLATWILAGLGATVYKIEPDVRLDGFRAVGGGGIYPDAIPRNPGQDSAMFNALNAGKERVALDLRIPAERDAFLELAGGCDVVIDSFSPRVMPNFGLAHLPEGPFGVSMPAFPPGPQRDWVAYGTGVHASLGLGERDSGTFAAPLVSYPDPVAGFTAALGVMAALVAGDLGRPVRRLEVSLAGATQPLVGWSGRLVPAGPGPGRALLAAGAFKSRPVGQEELPHPLSPFLDEDGSPVDENLF